MTTGVTTSVREFITLAFKEAGIIIRGDFINVGSGQEVSIKELAGLVHAAVYGNETRCRITWDTSKPNGTPRKLCDITRLLRLGYAAQTDLAEGIRKTYQDFLSTK